MKSKISQHLSNANFLVYYRLSKFESKYVGNPINLVVGLSLKNDERLSMTAVANVAAAISTGIGDGLPIYICHVCVLFR